MYMEDYLNKVLYFQLRERNIKYRYIQQIQKDIKNRMCSLLSVWQDQKKRNGILLFAREEADFYIPQAKNDIRAFVVTTIRNSMLEIGASDNCAQFKMTEPFSDEEIQLITKEAVSYFDSVDFEVFIQELDDCFIDVYKEAIDKYPLAWEAVFTLANMDVQEMNCSFLPEEIKIHEVMEEGEAKTSMNIVINDGYVLELDDELKQVIGEVISGHVDIFYSDCFKMISRNFEKVLHVLQILLENHCEVCTSNFYISNHLLSKRSKLLRASHTIKDAIKKQSNLEGTTGKLKETLYHMIEGVQE